MDGSQKSKYARTYRFFQEKINEFLQEYPAYFAYLPTRILNNCILLPIEAESQDTALRIFSTLNDRGKPLSDTDIFKAQFYKHYSSLGKKDEFIRRWKDLEAVCDDIFVAPSGSAMDELFTRYMYFERAKQGIKNTTTEALRKFYEKDSYAILKNNDTLDNLECLAEFWRKVSVQDEKFSDRVLKKLFVLNYAPNGMWTYLVSVYFMKYKDADDLLDEKQFFEFLNKITAFILGYSFIRPGVNALRSPVYPEMINIVSDLPVTFSGYKFGEDNVKNIMSSYVFTNGRPITKSILAWWAYTDQNQELMSLDTNLEIEHIYSKKRQENENSLKEKSSLESLGNKALLEKNINIRASDYRFTDKIKYYQGYTSANGKLKSGTKVYELLKLSNEKSDYTEQDIIERKKTIIEEFVQYLKDNELME